MIDSIFIALSGMQAHQRGLNTISNNVANLNTAAFRGSTVSFADVFSGNASMAARDAALFGQAQLNGSGVDATHILRDDKAGDAQTTGRSLDLFLQGDGFFVLQGEDGSTTYTRKGAFTFQDGVLLADDLKSKVMARNESGELVPIQLGQLQQNPGKATTTVTFTGNLVSDDGSFTISSTSVFDKTGKEHKLQMTFTKRAPLPGDPSTNWDVVITEGSTTVANTSISFFTQSSVSDPSMPVTLALPGTDPLNVTFDLTAVSNNPADPTNTAAKKSTLAVQKQDGFGTGTLTGETFDANGVLKLTYSNGQTIDGPKLALARIADQNALTDIGDSQFTYHGATPVVLRTAGDDVKIVAGSLEGSNVDLTRQFSELILMQRGYQASSEVLSTVNEMLQQLFSIRGGQR